jgi:transposase InsO family protein
VQAVLAKACQELPKHVLSTRVELDGWSAAEVRTLCDILGKYAATTFSLDKWDIGNCTTLPFRIDLKEGAHPVSERPYRYSPRMTELVKVEIDKLLAAGIIRPSASEWAFPVVAVLKPDGTARITVNYKKLNAQTVIPQIPLPNIEDLLNSLGNSTIFTTMDITSGYFTCPNHPDTIPLTAMVTSFGLFEWTRCPQGASGAPGHFTRLMQLVLQGLERVKPFIDDVIVHSTSVPQHLIDLEALFARLAQHGMKLVPVKVHVGCKRVKFLGHVVTPAGITVDSTKVQALLNMPTPSNVGQLRAWLGLASYYRRFVRNFARLVAPLTHLLKKETAFDVGERQEEAIRAVNEALALHTVMRYPDHEAARGTDRPFILATDASKDGFGAVLSQCDEEGVEQPIAFASRATLPNERNWSTTDQEAGAIIFGVRKFRHILWGTPFVLHTDHRALQYMESLREKTSRGARWSEFLSAFQHTVRYKKGSTHGNADGPSRNPLPATAEDAAEQERERLLESYGINMLDMGVLETQALQECLAVVMAVGDAAAGAAAEEAAEEGIGAGVAQWEPISRHPELGLMTAGDWAAAQAEDPQVAAIMEAVRGGEAQAGAGGAAHQVARWAEQCELRQLGRSEVLVRLEWAKGDIAKEGTPCVQLVIPKGVRHKLLHSLHGSPWAGHQGVHKTLERVRQHAWWPTWTADVTYWVSRCWPCQARKRSGHWTRWPTVWRDTPPHPFHTVGVDFFGPLPDSAGGHKYVLVFMDLYSGWVELYALSGAQANAAGVAEVLVQEYGTRHGVPCKLLSDRGSPFMAELARQVYRQMGITKLSTTAFHPQTNGKTERFMQTMAQMLAMVVDSAAADWHRWLPHVAFAYNTSVHTTTGVSPFLLTTGREPRLALHTLLGGLQADPVADLAAGVKELVTELLMRQQQAESVAGVRNRLKQEYVLRTNAKLAAAFGERHQYHEGDMVWLYRDPRTHTAARQTAEGGDTTGREDLPARVRYSKKLLDVWVGPYPILRVGPHLEGNIKVQRNCLLLDVHGVPTRVSVHQCKKCRDPGRQDERPETLPSGFARYLLTKEWRGGSPGSLTTDDVRPAGRHGVEAVLQHRIVAGARGRGHTLEYLVRLEGPRGEEQQLVWHAAHLLGACAEQLDEYWDTLVGGGNDVRGCNTPVVKERVRRAQRRRSTAGEARVEVAHGRYTLPPGAVMLPGKPTKAQVRSGVFRELRFMVQWRYDLDGGGSYTKWSEGRISRIPTRTKRNHRMTFLGDGSIYDFNPITAEFSTAHDAPAHCWFAFGTADQMAELLAADSEE